MNWQRQIRSNINPASIRRQSGLNGTQSINSSGPPSQSFRASLSIVLAKFEADPGLIWDWSWPNSGLILALFGAHSVLHPEEKSNLCTDIKKLISASSVNHIYSYEWRSEWPFFTVLVQVMNERTFDLFFQILIAFERYLSPNIVTLRVIYSVFYCLSCSLSRCLLRSLSRCLFRLFRLFCLSGNLETGRASSN